MLTKPSIDILEKQISKTRKTGVRYALCTTMSKRAKQLAQGQRPLVAAKEGAKPISVAAEEIAQGKIRPSADIPSKAPKNSR